MSGLGVDYEGDPNAPTLTSGSSVMPGTLVVAEVRPNYVVVEGADGSTARAISTGHAAGLGQIGEYVVYSYVLDQITLSEIAATRLESNISTVAASVEVASGGRYRPWVDYFVGDRLWVDLADPLLPAGWYRVEKIAARFTNEAEGMRYVVDVGRAVVTEDAAVADRLAKILYAGLIDTETGLVTAGNTGQASTTIVIQSDDIPAHTHLAANVTDLGTADIALGGDLSGTTRQATVERWRGYELAQTGAPGEGDTLLWNDANRIAEWSSPVTVLPFTIGGGLAVDTGILRLPITRSLTIVSVRAMAAVAPTGSSAIFDVNKNGTTIFTTQANRPTIADGATDSGNTTPDVTALAAGDYLTVDVDQVGATTSGENVIVVIETGRLL